jgi:hypothetical protein
VFGEESGGGTPKDEQRLGVTATLSISDTNSSSSTVSASSGGLIAYNVLFDEAIRVEGNQFFVCLDSMEDFVLLSDYVVVESACKCPSELYKHQSVKSVSGVWMDAHYSFLVEPIINYVTPLQTLRSELDTIADLRDIANDSQSPFSGIAAGDFDEDGDNDLVVNGRMLRADAASGIDFARTYVVDSLTSALLSSASLVATYRSRDQLLYVVDVHVSRESFQSHNWTVNGVRGKRLDVPTDGLLLFSMCATLGRAHGEWLIVGERRSHVDPAKRQHDRLLVIDPESGIRQVVDLHPGLYLHSATGLDLDVDGDIDILAACTDQLARPYSVVLINDNGVLAATKPHALSDIAVEVAPQIVTQERPCTLESESSSSADPIVTISSRDRRSSSIVATGTRKSQFAGLHSNSSDVQWSGSVSSAVWTDLDFDGISELLLCSPDSCRSPLLYSINQCGDWERVTGSMMDILAGSPDVLVTDIDADGRREVIGVVNGLVVAVVIEPNVPITDRISHVNQRVLAGTEPALVASDRDAFQWNGVTGRGINVHDRTSMPIRTASNARDVAVHDQRAKALRPNSQELADMAKRVPLEGRTSATVENKACSIVAVPNPVITGCRFQMPACDESVLSVRILTQDGRTIWQWEGQPVDGYVEWSGHSNAGAAVAAGVYLVQATTTRRVVSTTFVRQ